MSIPLMKEGKAPVATAAGAGIFLLGWWALIPRVDFLVVGLAAFLLAGFLANFFRDPERVPRVPLKAGEVLCPADGVVVACGEAMEPHQLKNRAFQVAVFMNVFDCHVQRAPFDGRVVLKQYHPGRFMAAFAEKASLDNEQAHLVLALKGGRGRRMVLKQIAGLLARRVVTDVMPGREVVRGERIGRILLGSRVDVFLPKGFKPLVRMGDRVKAGQTVLGVLS